VTGTKCYFKTTNSFKSRLGILYSNNSLKVTTCRVGGVAQVVEGKALSLTPSPPKNLPLGECGASFDFQMQQQNRK
jgi:hypothetical protein